ncbi:MAG TPA: hypothetical protein VMV74_02660 [Bacteroidales bacterium]|nr:hypothetical protein [Bacteroidales bacterium]
MNRLLSSFPILLAAIILNSCSDNKGGQQVSATQNIQKSSTEVVLNEELQAKLGSWLQKGTECYGIVVGYFADGSTLGKAVKCKVMSIKPDKIRMKTMESVSLLEGEGCDKMGLAYGDTWWEEEGDIFKTREKAEVYIKEKGWISNK